MEPRGEFDVAPPSLDLNSSTSTPTGDTMDRVYAACNAMGSKTRDYVSSFKPVQENICNDYLVSQGKQVTPLKYCIWKLFNPTKTYILLNSKILSQKHKL